MHINWGKLILIWLVFVLNGICLFSGTITYEKGVLHVRDYPSTSPTRPADLLAADRANGWNVVSFEAAKNQYTVKAELRIGDNVSTGTFFQIGEAGKPCETLLMKGNLKIMPSKAILERPDGTFGIVNRLTVGIPESKKIAGKLVFDCTKVGQYQLRSGHPVKGKKQLAPQLFVYNGELTSTKPKQPFAVVFNFSRAEFVRARISGFTGSLLRRNGSWPFSGVKIENSVFENGNTIFTGYGYPEPKVISSTFRSIKQVIICQFMMGAKFVDCVFENNRENWRIAPRKGRRAATINLLDCDIGTQAQPLFLEKSRGLSTRAIGRGVNVYGRVNDRRTLIVKVVNEADSPVKGAFVFVSCENDIGVVENGAGMTQSDGCTRSKSNDNPIKIVARSWEATNDPTAPKETIYSYVVRVCTAEGAVETHRLVPANDQTRPFIVRLKKNKPLSR